MIAYLSGIVHEVKGNMITLLVNGIGFAVHIPVRYGLQKGLPVCLEIHSHTTQDNGVQFFGFETEDEKLIFTMIIGCSGLGPKIALSVLNVLSPSLVISAILTNDIKTLSSLDGVGPKKAESMIIQLRDKAAKINLSHIPTTETVSQVKQLSDVLVSLGYSRQEITATLDHLTKEGGFQQIPFDQMVRKGLGFLSKK